MFTADLFVFRPFKIHTKFAELFLGEGHISFNLNIGQTVFIIKELSTCFFQKSFQSSIFQRPYRHDLYSVSASIGHFAAGNDKKQIRLTKRDLLFFFVVFSD